MAPGGQMKAIVVYALAVASIVWHGGWEDVPRIDRLGHALGYYLQLGDKLPEELADVRVPGIPPALVWAIAYKESRFTERVEGRILKKFRARCELGETDYCPRPLGVMQVVPDRNTPYKPREILETEGSFAAGLFLLRYYRSHVGSDFVCAYGGSAGYCARSYERDVRDWQARYARVYDQLVGSGRCLEPSDLLQACLPDPDFTR